MIPDIDYDVERASYFELDLKLKKYEELKNLLKTKLVTSVKVVESDKSCPLKINKPDALKFSGEARDFASFKRDFLAIVVPHREDAQIGMHLKQAIPDNTNISYLTKILLIGRGCYQLLKKNWRIGN